MAIHLARSINRWCRESGHGGPDDVKALAEAVQAQTGSIDVLIHSAGGLQPSAARTREGVDRGFAQNFLGAFLLTRLLEQRLLASAPARLIAVGSSTHRYVKKADLDTFMHPIERPLGVAALDAAAGTLCNPTLRQEWLREQFQPIRNLDSTSR